MNIPWQTLQFPELDSATAVNQFCNNDPWYGKFIYAKSVLKYPVTFMSGLVLTDCHWFRDVMVVIVTGSETSWS